MNTKRKLKRRIHKTRRQYHQKAGEREIVEPKVEQAAEQEVQGEVSEPIESDVEREVESPDLESEIDQPSESNVEREQEVFEKETLDEETLDEETLDEETLDEEAVDEEAVDEDEKGDITKIYREEIPNIHMEGEWKINLNTKGNRLPPMVYLELHGIGKKPLKKYMVDHILDAMSHDERLNLAKHIKNPSFVATKPLERHIVEYFDFLTIRDAERTCLVLGKTCYDLNNNWRILILKERDEMYRNRFFVDIDDLSDIFGYIEDGVFKINNNGRICTENSTKTEMIGEMNEILKLSGSNYWYDTATTREKPRRNSDNLSHEAFCAVTELYLRKLNAERVNKKIWFLKPEQRELLFKNA